MRFFWHNLVLTALVPAVLWVTVKKYGALRGRVAYQLKEQKRLQYEQSTLQIKDLSMGPYLVFSY